MDAFVVIDSADQNAPAHPTDLIAVSSNLMVELYWKANQEEDLEGYHVYRSTSLDSGFQRINTWLVKDR